MTKTSGFWASLAVAALLCGPALAQDTTAETVVATVDGTDITLGHMIALRASLPAQYQSLPDDVLFNGILDQLIQQTTLQQSIKDIKKADQLAMDNDRRGYLSGVALQDVVAGAVTDAALQTAYDAKYTNATPGKEFNAAHILVEEEAKATEIMTALQDGGDFATLARENSIDTGSGANGGDLGWFGLGMMVKPFEDAVVGAEVGKIIGPIQSDFGYHLILVKETRAQAAPTLDDVRDELAADIERIAVETHIKALTDAATITRPGEGIDPALLKDAKLIE